jgi:teichuronic acid biosynthesis glycosyltransferase TuaC
MRVLVISHMYPKPYNEVNGIFVHEQVKALTKKGIEVKVVSPTPWSPYPISFVSSKWKGYKNVPHYLEWEGIPVWYPRYLAFPKGYLFASSGQRMFHGIKKMVIELEKQYSFDLIHAHVALPDGYSGMCLSSLLKKPLIVTIHGQDFYQTINKNISCLRAVKKVINHATRVIVVSKKLNIIGKNIHWDNDIYSIIPNGINLEKVAAKKGKSDKTSEDCSVVLSVSYLIKRKAIDYNIKAIQALSKKYPYLNYKIVGDGSEKNNLVKLVNDLKMNEHIEFLGLKSHQEVMSYMAECDIFSLPSWNEAFGVVYIEAMAHGKPIIACKGEGIEDVVTHMKTGMLVKPKDVDSLVEAMDYLLSHPEEAKAMGERARQMVLENYTWEKNAEKTIKVYEDVLQKA